MKITADTLKGAVVTIQEIVEVIPMLTTAYNALFNIWKAQNPDGTFDQFNAALKAAADDEVNFTAGWLIAHGYQKNAAGDWVKVPVTPPTPALPPPTP